MTRSQILADIKAMIGHGNDTQDSEINTWINEAYSYAVDEVLKVNPDYFVKEATTSLVANQEAYSLPTDFTNLVNINVSFSGTWRQLTSMEKVTDVPVLADANNFSFSETDPRFYILGNEIYLRPIPTSNVSAGLKVWYTYTPEEMDADSDIPAIPSRYHYILKYLPYANFLDRDDEHVSAERLRIRFETLVSRMVETLDQRQSVSPEYIQVVNGQDLYYNDDVLVF